MMKWIEGVCFISAIAFAHASYAEMVCPYTEYGHYWNNFPTIDAEEIIQTNNALFEGGKIKCRISYDHRIKKIQG